MDLNKQHQGIEGSGTAIQSGRDVVVTVNQGLSYADVHSIAVDVFKANFMELKGNAMELARQRFEEITEQYLQKLQKEFPAGLQQAESPAFQDALFNVQKEYAKTGDVDLGALLVNLLVDRTRHENRDLMQLVLTEALNTAPKITKQQLDLLSIIFFLKRAQAYPADHEGLGALFKMFLEPFSTQVKASEANFSYLEFTGCGSTSMLQANLGAIFENFYGGLFRKGLHPDQLNGIDFPAGISFKQCLNDPTKVQFAALNWAQIETVCNASGVDDATKNTIKGLFDNGKMSEGEVQEIVVRHASFMQVFFETWNATPMMQFNLTSVGVALGHSNLLELLAHKTVEPCRFGSISCSSQRFDPLTNTRPDIVLCHLTGFMPQQRLGVSQIPGICSCLGPDVPKLKIHLCQRPRFVKT